MNIFHKVTLKTLRVNKTRTIVTIIGIILSLSMFTAVTVSVSSFQNYLLKIAISREGNWHAYVPVTAKDIEGISSDNSIEEVSFLNTVGYARLEDSINPDKPYLYIGGMDKNAENMLPLNITSGRLPENDTELLIPAHLSYNGGVEYKLNETVTLEIGDRVSKDEKGNPCSLFQDSPYRYTEEELRAQEHSEKGPTASDDDFSFQETEALVPRLTRTYTVVGFYDRPATEPYSAPGYTALTVSDKTIFGTDTASGTDSYTAYIHFANPKEAIPWMERHYPNTPYQPNYDLLRMYGASFENSYNRVLYNMAAILIFIILFGSISLIYNAFSISVTERTKQFGLLSSLGATRRQLIHSVLFEAFSLCIIGIPLGILAGIAGIGITFSLLGASVSDVFLGNRTVLLTLHVSPLAVAGAALIGLFTVLISAYLPAKRSAKLSPIDAIRQTADIAIRARSVKTSRLTYRLFGLSGMLASKNFKRNRKKYRATVISLFVSIVLFISASSFCSYLLTGAESVMSDAGCDIIYRRYTSDTANTVGNETDPADGTTAITNDELLGTLSSIEGITEAAWCQQIHSTIYFDESSLSPEYRSFMTDALQERNDQGQIGVYAQLYFIGDETYQTYLAKNGLSTERYYNPSQPTAVISDFLRFYNSDTGKYTTLKLLAAPDTQATLLQLNVPEGYTNYGYYTDNDGNNIYYFKNETTGKEIELPEEDCTTPSALTIGAAAPDIPFFLGDNYGDTLMLLYPASAMDAVLGQGLADSSRNTASVFYFTAEDHRSAAENISKTLQELGLESTNVHDLAESAAQERTLLMIITVFSYGFIILISLIAMANVFNTISTNIQLRKREFAMLRSTGMTPRGFRIMMCYECLLYGIKGLLYGLPVSIAITFWIYRSILNGWDTSFYIPWYSLVIAIGSVFLVVGSTMIYSMKKIGKENIMDNLKSETT